nr:hypothetical protein [uncultured Psychroserpens sp.]
MFDNTKELVQRPLKVVLLKEGKEKNDTYNTYIKSAIESELTIIENYSFITKEEYEDLKKDKSSDFAFLIYYPKKATTSTTMTATSSTSSTKQTNTTFNEDGLVLYGFNKKGKKIKTIGGDICFEKSCTLADYYFSIQNMQSQIFGMVNAPKVVTKMKEARAMIEKAQKEQQDNIKKLENMTLYVNEKSINETLKGEFGKYYKYNYKIVSFEDIENAVLENNTTAVILYADSIKSADTGFPLLSFIDMKKMKGFKVSAAPIVAGTIFKDIFSHEITKKDLTRLKEILN